MMTHTEIIDTDKSPQEIRDIIEKNTDKNPDFIGVITYKPSSPFISKQGDNYISLKSTNLLRNWPFIELQMREHIKPRLKIVFQGLYFFLALYLFWLIAYLIAIFNFDSSKFNLTNGIPMIVYGLVLLFIPYYAYRLQSKFKIWLTKLLNE